MIRLRPTGGEFSVYEKLSDNEKGNPSRIKAVLYKAFAIDLCIAYENFSTSTLWPGETMDVYLAAMKKLTILFGGLPERALSYAFLAGLLASVKQILRANSSVDSLALNE